ncbi:fasciculation and elongation protein zeta-2 isoform X1 [Tribolium castaneum]|uniref:fasciculation and elongation protein zeta-2 isoform X1 n=1 Tax=Tribolium castaneum TaxID=7070 RepID=UPI0000D55E57|nr:PREDICTED: fasciculation and elongation protein zeta-2 isoform X1 [Tribolium castaneum]|eukprot:XP_975626.3 PREDICTED: fasciculation and elongation protein zeta-2 isoform X1 [Tribolium castaneum]
MRDLATKMAELKFEAPLAQFEESDEWGSTEFQNATIKNENELNNINLNKKIKDINDVLNDFNEDILNNSNTETLPPKNVILKNGETASVADNFTETFSGSLEDLVNTFDEKITKCFGNYEESVEKLAPVQVRTQEEIMNECQMWWTITGNFGNILPIDWSKSYARKLHMPALNLNEKEATTPDDDLELSSEDEAVASDLDMHALILGGLHQDTEPLKTADEVIQEIDDMMQEETCSLDGSPGSRDSIIETNETLEKAKEVLSSPLYEDKLRDLSLSQLNELFLELEVLIREFSETLISELALRDELEYEKELKNTFISLLLAVQNKRRQYHVEKKRSLKNASKTPSGLDPKYLTTVIPYHLDSGPPDNQTLQVLIKILKAINEDSPTVPTLLTDYILKVICPT